MKSRKAVNDVIMAWSVEGKCPAYHRKMKDYLHRQWPLLAQALDSLCEFQSPHAERNTK